MPSGFLGWIPINHMTNATQLIQALTDHPLGLCGQHDPAKSVRQVEALEERLNLLAFGAVMSTDPLPASGWETLAALHDHWLFLPGQVAYRSSQEVLTCMQALHIRAPRYIARVWWQVCRGVQGRFKGSWRDLLAANADDAQALEGYLLQSKSTFPGPVRPGSFCALDGSAPADRGYSAARLGRFKGSLTTASHRGCRYFWRHGEKSSSLPGCRAGSLGDCLPRRRAELRAGRLPAFEQVPYLGLSGRWPRPRLFLIPSGHLPLPQSSAVQHSVFPGEFVTRVATPVWRSIAYTSIFPSRDEVM